MFDSPVIPMTVFFLSFAAIFVLRGPFGKALAERLAGRGGAAEREIHELRGEIDELRRQLADMEERLDFTERVVAKGRDAAQLRPGA